MASSKMLNGEGGIVASLTAKPSTHKLINHYGNEEYSEREQDDDASAGNLVADNTVSYRNSLKASQETLEKNEYDSSLKVASHLLDDNISMGEQQLPYPVEQQDKVASGEQDLTEDNQQKPSP